MSYIKQIKKDITLVVQKLGYDIEKVDLTVSNRPDLGDYQINDAMKLAKMYYEKPRIIAEKIKEELEKDYRFENINIAGPGFINISLSNSALLEFLKDINKDVKNNIDLKKRKRVVIDYGGANIAKTLHVGHLRGANIGEAIKRLARALGIEVISDVHFGDIGRQSGTVISEIKRLYPNLAYFQKDYDGQDVDFTITASELGEIYPRASLACKEDASRMEEARQITADLEQGHKGYVALWNKIKKVSIADIKAIYKRINTDFDLWEGETDCYPYIPKTIAKLQENDNLYESEGALVIDVAKDTDTRPMPPLVIVQSNGATLYATRDLATIYSRVKRFDPDEIWYVTDLRQGLYFEQIFRASKKANLVSNNLVFQHIGFGTMNGPDGKPFKTRDGGVMDLKSLIDMVIEETSSRLNPGITDLNERKEIAEKIAIAALKYADFLPFRTTDYVFEPSKFVDLEGKTGPYLLYSTIRMKSLLNKSDIDAYDLKVVDDKSTRDIIITLLNLPDVIDQSYKLKSLNDIAEYLYKLTSVYNKFYAENRILTEENTNLKEFWLSITRIVKETNEMLLDILGIEVPEKM